MIGKAFQISGWMLLAGVLANVSAQEPVKGIVALKEEGPVTYGRSAKIKATVEAIDAESRHLTVMGPRGYSMRMRVADRVRNLPDIRVGDEVTVRYNESVGLALHKLDASAGEGSPQTVAFGEPADGHKVVDAEVQAVAVKQKTLSLKDADGNIVDLYVRDTKLLETLEVGELIRATHSEAVVVSIEPPKSKDKDKNKKKKK
ncbi:MAG: hypothetical protein ACKVP2_16025 [Burkholderiales bacterium]